MVFARNAVQALMAINVLLSQHYHCIGDMCLYCIFLQGVANGGELSGVD